MTKTNQKIPEGWSVKKLGEMGKFVSGGTPDTEKPEYWNGDIIWLTPSEITKLPTRFVSDSERKITRAGLKNSSAVLLPVGSLIICTRATVGDCCINIKEVSTNQGFKNLIPENSNIDFLYYLISSHKTDLIRKACGSTFLEISKHDIEKLKYSVPPLPEQEKIAEILGTWDLAIEKLTALIEQKKLLKKGLMQRLLTGKQRLPGFSEPWKKVKLGECFSFLKTSSYSRAETTDCGEVHYIHYGDIHTKYPLHIFPKDINIYISTKQASKSDCLKTGDLILLDASEDYEGTTKCVELLNISDDEKVVSGLHTLALRDSTQNFINGFRAYITSIPFVKNNFWKQVTGIKVYGVSKDNLKKIKIPIPSLSEQKAIADILSKADEEIDLLTAKLSALKSQKKGLMQKLLTGQIRVKVA